MRDGWFRAHRKLFDTSGRLHPATTGESACQGFAWLDLVGQARWEAGGGLERGQLRASVRFLASRWNWSSAKAARFLVLLETRKAIRRETQGGRRPDVLTICNYDRYNPPAANGRDASETRVSTQSETPVSTKRRKKKPKEQGTPPAKRVTWLTPYIEAWVSAYGGQPTPGQLAKSLKPLHDEHGEPAVLLRWREYLRRTEASFASPSRFAATFGTWAPGSEPMSELGFGDDDFDN